jgi:hypothetical protein
MIATESEFSKCKPAQTAADKLLMEIATKVFVEMSCLRTDVVGFLWTKAKGTAQISKNRLPQSCELGSQILSLLRPALRLGGDAGSHEIKINHRIAIDVE